MEWWGALTARNGGARCVIIVSLAAVSRDSLIPRCDDLLRTTIHSQFHSSHHLNLAAASKLLIPVCLIHTMLDIGLEAKGFLQLVLQPDSPARLTPRKQIKVRVTPLSKHILFIICHTRLRMLLDFQLRLLMNNKRIGISYQRLSRPTLSPLCIKETYDVRRKSGDLPIQHNNKHLMPQIVGNIKWNTFPFLSVGGKHEIHQIDMYGAKEGGNR